MTDVVLSRVLHDYPWLTEADVEVVLSRPRTRAAHRPGAPEIAAAPKPDDEAVDIAYEDVERELHERRLEWVMPDEEMTQHFYTQVRGGAWTARMTCVAVDSFMVKCRAHSAGFCHRFNLPKQKTFAFAKYGQAAAAELGREWCRFLNHYMEVWQNSGQVETFIDPASHTYEWSEPFIQFVAGLDEGSPAMERVIELQNARPGMP